MLTDITVILYKKDMIVSFSSILVTYPPCMNLSFRLLSSFDQNYLFFHTHAIYVVEEVIVLAASVYVLLCLEKNV